MNLCKKRIYVVFFLLIFQILLLGCSSDGGFKIVKSVTFTTGGQTRTLYSDWWIITGEAQGFWKEISQSEYDAASNKMKLGPYLATSQLTVNSSEIFTGPMGSLPNGSSLYYPYGLSNSDIGENFFIKTHTLGGYAPHYYKTEFVSIGNSILEIKVIDNDHIIIKRGSGETTYNVTSFSVRNF